MAAPPPPLLTPAAPGLPMVQGCPVCAPVANDTTGGMARIGASCGFGGAGLVIFILAITKFIQGKRLGNNAAPPAAMVAYTPAISPAAPAPESGPSTPARASASTPALLPPPPAPAAYGYGYGYVAQPMLIAPSTSASFAYAAPPPPPPVEDDGSAATAAYSAGFAAGAASLSGCAIM